MDNAYINEDLVKAILANHGKNLQIAYGLCKDWHTAEDIVQEAYIRTLKAVHHRRGLASYIFLTIRSIYVDRIRAQSIRIKAEPADMPELEKGARIINNAPEDKELSDEIQNALNELSSETADMLLDAAEGMEAQHIAAKYAVGSSATTTRLHRARKKISGLLVAANPDRYGRYLR